MMVSLRHRLVILAMPKCASSALEEALTPHMDVVIRGMPSAKHTPFRKYNRFLKKYFEGFSDGPMETVCLFRQPVDWLNSWWRYRGRPDIPNPARSTEGMSFDAFVTRYLDGANPPADLGRQSRFISDASGVPCVDHLFRYERLDELLRLVTERMGLDVELERLNVSPQAHNNPVLSIRTQRRLHRELKEDFAIYESLGGS